MGERDIPEALEALNKIIGFSSKSANNRRKKNTDSKGRSGVIGKNSKRF